MRREEGRGRRAGAPSQVVVDDLGGAHVSIEGGEAEHLRKVLRLRPGDRVSATDGRGTRGVLEITSFGRGRVETAVRERRREPAPERRYWIATRAAGPRFDWLVEKAVEMGAAGLIALVPDGGPRPRLERWERLARAALGQCLGAWATTLASAGGAREAVERGVPEGGEWTSVQVADATAGRAMDPRVGLPGDHLLLVGPPEGFGPADRDFLAGRPETGRIRLGERRLRSETAALALLALATLGRPETVNSPGRG